MTGKTLHFISHSHWDREWYMSFESHRFRLIELIDDVLETLDHDSDFKSFFLDGQIIALEDYLEIKPYNKEKIKKYVAEGRILIGPWYVLQDAYLISGESNVRNMLYGIKECEKYGQPVMIGYYPDTFGNISQTAQILRGFNIDCAVFGRGLNAVESNNSIVLQKGISDSEMIWKSPDGSDVTGVMLPNWYCNAMEIPEITKDAIERIEGITVSAERFAKTPHLLCMNGCDHEPLQKNIAQLLKSTQTCIKNRLIHSNFADYFNSIKPYRDQFKTFEGEIEGQYTNGYGQLVGTASARIYLKQLNNIAQNNLEKRAEPIGSMAFLMGDDYRSDQMYYSWKTLMKNHPHDSICGCNCDDVCREMKTRFHKSIQVSEELIQHSTAFIAEAINTEFAGDNKVIVVFNPHNEKTTEVAKVTIDYPEEEELPENPEVYDSDGNLMPCEVVYCGKKFKYLLPRHTFRQAINVNRYEVEFLAKEIPGTGYKTFVFKKSASLSGYKNTEHSNPDFSYNDHYAENPYLRVDLNQNGTLTLTDKKAGRVYKKLNWFEEVGDAGNEYDYRMTADKVVISSLESIPVIKIADSSTLKVTFEIAYQMRIPDGIKEDQTRSDIFIEMPLTTFVSVYSDLNRVDIKTKMINFAENHRIRAIFESGLVTEKCYADGHFDLIERTIQPWEGWENPSIIHRMNDFIMLKDDSCALSIAAKGLHEYEILKDRNNSIAVTLLRGVGQIGDWGYFSTPDAQCKGENVVEYSIIPSGANEKECWNAAKSAHMFNILPLTTVTTTAHGGKYKNADSLLETSCEGIQISALKKAERCDSFIARIYNYTGSRKTVKIKINECFKSAWLMNLNEDRLSELAIEQGAILMNIDPKKIVTIELAK